MENIDLQLSGIPTVWTTCSKSRDRHAPMESMLSSLGLKGEKVEGPITTPYTVGVSHGYIEALTRFSPPFMVLEDDATLVAPLNSLSVSCPADTDALYLGTSIYGRLKGKTHPGGVIAASVDSSLMRVFNMLGFHAVIYLTKRYVDHVLNTLNDFIETPIGGCDDPIAESMWRYNIYSLKSPIFYQKDGRSDDATRHPIDILL